MTPAEQLILRTYRDELLAAATAGPGSGQFAALSKTATRVGLPSRRVHQVWRGQGLPPVFIRPRLREAAA